VLFLEKGRFPRAYDISSFFAGEKASGAVPIVADILAYGVRGKKCTKPAAADAKAAKSWTDALRIPAK